MSDAINKAKALLEHSFFMSNMLITGTKVTLERGVLRELVEQAETAEQQAETINQLEARVARLAGLFDKLKTHGQFFYSAIELDHDIDGEAFEVELDQMLTELPKQSLTHIQADIVHKFARHAARYQDLAWGGITDEAEIFANELIQKASQ